MFTNEEIQQRIIEILPSGTPTDYPYDWINDVFWFVVLVVVPLVSWLVYRER